MRFSDFAHLYRSARPRAAHRITNGVPELNAQFVALALAEKKGFFREDGIQAHVIGINTTVTLAGLVKLRINNFRFQILIFNSGQN